MIVHHARCAGSITNTDVRGLLAVDRYEALRLLDDAVARGLLYPVGQRRWRHYAPTAQSTPQQKPQNTG